MSARTPQSVSAVIAGSAGCDAMAQALECGASGRVGVAQQGREFLRPDADALR